MCIRGEEGRGGEGRGGEGLGLGFERGGGEGGEIEMERWRYILEK